jgi:chromosome partitioning protein
MLRFKLYVLYFVFLKPSAGICMDARITATEAAQLLGISVQAVHKKLKTQDLPFEKSQNRVYFGHNTARKLFNFTFKQKTLAVEIVKGGVGKTSIVQATAIRASLFGARVLCIDLDQQGNLTQALGVNPEEVPVMVDIIKEKINIENAIVKAFDGVDLIPSRIENAVLDALLMLGSYPLDRIYLDLINQLKYRYDLIIFDCPPALGQSVAAATLASDGIITPVTPEKFCLSGLKITSQELANIEQKYKKQIPLRIVLNKYDSRTSLSHEVLTSLVKHPTYGENMYKTYIRISQDFPNAIARGDSIFDTLKTTTAKEDIDLLTREIMEIRDRNADMTGVSLGSLDEFQEEDVNEPAIV